MSVDTTAPATPSRRVLLAATLLGGLALALPAQAQIGSLEIMAPAGPGGGYDQLARAAQEVLQARQLASGVQVVNVPGAGGTIGLAQFVTKRSRNPGVMVVGLGMVGAILTNKAPVTLEQVTEVEDRRLVRDVGKPAQLREAAHHRRVVQGFFHRRVAERVPLLQEMDAQHRRQRVRLAAGTAQLRVVRLDQRQQRLPRHHLLHLGQEDLPPRALALAQGLGITERQLHRSSPQSGALLSPAAAELFRPSLSFGGADTEVLSGAHAGLSALRETLNNSPDVGDNSATR